MEVQLKPVQIPFDARQIEALFAGLVLLEMQDVSTVPENEIGDGRVEAFSVRALHQ